MLDTVSNINGRNSQIQPKPRTINGRGIKRRRLSRHQRVDLAADCVTGAVLLRPSIEQASQLFDVPKGLVRKHLKPHNGNGRAKPKPPLAVLLRESTSAELVEAARTLGIGVIWDRMIEPVLDEERGVMSGSSK